MRPKLRLGIWRVGVRIPRAAEDRAALDTRVEALFAQGEALEGFECVLFGCTAVFFFFFFFVNN